MKKNLVPLLGIAFVVAIATTGIFYGLFVGKLGASAPAPVVVAIKELKPGTTINAEMVKVTSWNGAAPSGSFTATDQVVGRIVAQPVADGDPVLTAGLQRSVSAEASVPSHQRAVSTHVTDSLGVLEMLHPGDHVDVQVLSGPKSGDAEIRTILQNKTVLAIHGNPEATSHGAAAAPVVTLLVDRNESEALALADSTARVRLALRNPNDSDRNGQVGLGFTTLLRNGAPKTEVVEMAAVTPVETVKPMPSSAAPPAPATSVQAPPEIQLQVQVLGAIPAALEELFRPAESTGRPDVFQALTVRRPVDLAATLRNLEQQKSVEIVSTSQVRTGLSSSVSLQAGKQDPHAGVRIRFSPFRAPDGHLRLEIEPEVTTPSAVRKLDTKIDIANGQAFLIGGLVQAKERAAVLDKFFGGRELVVIVTPRMN
jgi:Flp pilus assembly protein CpaB